MSTPREHELLRSTGDHYDNEYILRIALQMGNKAESRRILRKLRLKILCTRDLKSIAWLLPCIDAALQGELMFINQKSRDGGDDK